MRITTIRSLLLLLTVNGLSTALAEEQGDSEKMLRCISIPHLRSIDILDDQHIIFHTIGKKQYLNTLPHKCIGLRKDSTIMYRTSLNKLCDLDMITVLHNFGGGFTPGASCGLGRFEPIFNEQLEALKEQ